MPKRQQETLGAKNLSLYSRDPQLGLAGQPSTPFARLGSCASLPRIPSRTDARRPFSRPRPAPRAGDAPGALFLGALFHSYFESPRARRNPGRAGLP